MRLKPHKVLSEGQSQLDFAAEHARWEGRWRVLELGLFLALSPHGLGVAGSFTIHGEMSQCSSQLTALLPPGHPLGCLPSLHSHGEVLRGSRNKDVRSQFTRIQV